MKYLPLLLLCLNGCVWHDFYRVNHDYPPMDDAALALPLHVQSDYLLLKEFIELRYPQYEIVFINEDEKLLNPNAEDTHISTVSRTFTVKGLRLWALRKSV